MAPKTYNKRIPDFFQPYLAKPGFGGLRIPNDFKTHLNGSLKNAELRNRMGKVWHVRMDYTDNGVFFVNGWQKFVEDNSVEHKDILVFRYDGNHRFDVMIMGKSCCEKRETGVNVGIDVEDIKMEVEVEEEENVKEKDEEGDIVHDVDDYHGGSDDDNEDCNEEEEKEAEEVAEDEELEATTIMKCRGKKISRNNGGSKRRAAGSAVVHEETNSEWKETEVRKHVQPQNPYFWSTVMKSKKDLLFIPSHVLKDFGIKLPEKMTFLDEMGRSWPGEIIRWKDGRVMIKGWRAVCRWNHVDKDTHCICELLGGEGKKWDTIEVHIIRRGG